MNSFMNTKTAYFDRFSLELPVKCVFECSRPGPMDEPVAKWAGIVGRQGISPDRIREELEEISDWDVSDDDTNWGRLIWVASCNINEEETE